MGHLQSIYELLNIQTNEFFSVHKPDIKLVWIVGFQCFTFYFVIVADIKMLDFAVDSFQIRDALY